MADKIPFKAALNKVIEGLKKQPLLLFVFGFSLLLISLAFLGTESLRALVLPLLIVYIMGIICWVLLKVNKLRGAGKITTGNIKVSNADIKDTESQTGNVQAQQKDTGLTKSGDIILNKSDIEGSKLKTGSVKGKN